MQAADNKIKEVIPSWSIDPVAETLRDVDCRKYLSELHSQYVIAPIDKATGNVALICKRFYADVLVKELGLKGDKSNTYELVKKNSSSVIKTNKKDLYNKFGIDVSGINETLPNIY